MTEERFDEWAVLELLGHRRLGGRVTEATIAGGAFLRIDIPADGEHAAATQYVSPGSVYALTPTTEEMARAVARTSRPQPVQRWELKAIEAPAQLRRDLEEWAEEDETDEEPDDSRTHTRQHRRPCLDCGHALDVHAVAVDVRGSRCRGINVTGPQEEARCRCGGWRGTPPPGGDIDERDIPF